MVRINDIPAFVQIIGSGRFCWKSDAFSAKIHKVMLQLQTNQLTIPMTIYWPFWCWNGIMQDNLVSRVATDVLAPCFTSPSAEKLVVRSMDKQIISLMWKDFKYLCCLSFVKCKWTYCFMFPKNFSAKKVNALGWHTTKFDHTEQIIWPRNK